MLKTFPCVPSPSKRFDSDRLVQALSSFAGRAAQSSDPAIANAARQLQRELNRAKIQNDNQ